MIVLNFSKMATNISRDNHMIIEKDYFNLNKSKSTNNKSFYAINFMERVNSLDFIIF